MVRSRVVRRDSVQEFAPTSLGWDRNCGRGLVRIGACCRYLYFRCGGLAGFETYLFGARNCVLFAHVRSCEVKVEKRCQSNKLIFRTQVYVTVDYLAKAEAQSPHLVN